MLASRGSRGAGARTIAEPPPDMGLRSRADIRRWQRRLAAFVLPLGPAAVAVLRFVLPYRTTDEPAAVHGVPPHIQAIVDPVLPVMTRCGIAAAWLDRPSHGPGKKEGSQ
jgi:hypothetical protein